jgi:hypothetical protein
LAKLQLDIPELAADGKTTLAGPSEVTEFLGVEIRRFHEGYRLCAPTKKLAQIDADLAEMASVEWCLSERKNLGQLIRVLDSFVVGHIASMAVLGDAAHEFANRLNASKEKHVRALLIEMIGEAAVKRLNPDHLAILGLGSFAAVQPRG